MLRAVERDGIRVYEETTDGRTWPSVSSVLAVLNRDRWTQIASLGEDVYVAQLIGTGGHRVACNIMAHKLKLIPEPWYDIPAPDVIPVVKWNTLMHLAYKLISRWAEEERVVPLLVESPSKSDLDGVAGTPDLLARWRGRTWPSLFDFKFTAAVLPENLVQVQAYKRLDDYKIAKEQRVVHVDLKRQAVQVVHVPDDPFDVCAYLGAAQVLKWQRLNKII